MKKVILLGIIAALQPVFWWLVYTVLYDYSLKSDSKFGLAVACIGCGMFIPIGIVILLSTKNYK